jgi:ribosomal protein S8
MSVELIKFIVLIKNSLLTNKKFVITSKSKHKLILINLLYKEGLILSYESIKNSYKVFIKNITDFSNFKFFKIISSPSFSKYIKYEDLCKLTFTNTCKQLILSTNKGLLLSNQCIRKKVGGKIYCAI